MSILSNAINELKGKGQDAVSGLGGKISNAVATGGGSLLGDLAGNVVGSLVHSVFGGNDKKEAEVNAAYNQIVSAYPAAKTVYPEFRANWIKTKYNGVSMLADWSYKNAFIEALQKGTDGGKWLQKVVGNKSMTSTLANAPAPPTTSSSAKVAKSNMAGLTTGNEWIDAALGGIGVALGTKLGGTKVGQEVQNTVTNSAMKAWIKANWWVVLLVLTVIGGIIYFLVKRKPKRGGYRR